MLIGSKVICWSLLVVAATLLAVDAARDLPVDFKAPTIAERRKDLNTCVYLGVEGSPLPYNLWTCGMPKRMQYCQYRTSFVYDCCPGFAKSDFLGGKCGEVMSVWRLIPDYLKTYGFAKFGSVLDSITLTSALADNSSLEVFTVLTPYNEYLAKSLEENEHPALRHVVRNRFYSVDMKDGTVLESLHPQKNLKVTVYSNDFIFIECRALVKPNLEAKNGVIHVISGPLPVYRETSVLKVLEGNPATQDFAKDLSAEVRQKLAKEDSSVWYTVYAPKAEAWRAIKVKYTNKKIIERIAANHVMERMICSEAITQRSMNVGPTLEDQYIGVTCEGQDHKRYLLDASGQKVEIITKDQMSSNGVVHILGGVLVPPSVMTMREALAAYGLREDLAISKSVQYFTECDITVTDSSNYLLLIPLAEAYTWFEAYKPFSQEYQRFLNDKTYRCNVFRYHVLQLQQQKIQGMKLVLWNQDSYSTLYNFQGAFSVNYHVKYRHGSELYFEYSRAKGMKLLRFLNGYIYLMDRINVIPEKTRFEVMQGRQDLSAIVEKIQSGNYKDFLYQRGPFSLYLAPRNRGWSGRAEAKYTGSALTNFLRLHTVRLRLWGDDLGYFERETYQTVETELIVNGKPFQLRFKRNLDGNMFIGYDGLPEKDWAMVLEWNLYGTDGIIWIIDWPIRCPLGQCDALVLPDRDYFVVYATACAVQESVATPKEYDKDPLGIAKNNPTKCVVFKLPAKESYREWKVTQAPAAGK